MRVQAADGWTLDVERRPATGARRGCALLLHAMMVDRRTLDRPRGQGFATTLSRAGFEVFAADLRGHGASTPRPPDGRWRYDDLVLRDVPALVAAVREARPGERVVVAGHSLGGHVTLASLAAGATPPVDGLALLSCGLWRRRHAVRKRERLRREVQMAAFGLLCRRGYFPTRRLRMGTADEAAGYVGDLRRLWATSRWASADGRHDYDAGLPTVTTPVLAVLSHTDGTILEADVRPWLAPVPRHEVRVTHVPVDHMGLVTDPRARAVWTEIADWLANV